MDLKFKIKSLIEFENNTSYGTIDMPEVAQWIEDAVEVLKDLALEGCYCSDGVDLGDLSPCRSCLAKILMAKYSEGE